ncbi:CvpA family protein [Rufibacter roseus]|uniref:CvpA family protein n=1 Tax=Rufibacter roseus TaxID=1567108 RepID=A0ABW2DKF6_9BACT|nr:CvpA family protein [Rufibacter roseus]
MSAFDFFLLLPIGYGAIRGFFKGFILEIASLLAFIIIAVFGLKLVGLVTPTVNEWVGEDAWYLSFLPYLLVFLGVGFAVRALGLMLKKAVHLTPLGLLDNLGGALFGAAKWAFAIALLVYFAHISGLDTSMQTVRESEVYPFFVEAAPGAWAFVQWIIPFGREALESFDSM